ncbi:uncharacterized protein EI90DRAFT_3035901 [Cantharellus anzutake]|uniref:uncharacterized protein n=1 Tax=Cantharellus anzutake TaxID=1750568 RepID=UPI0019036283|nr:uncharacterized protein EI90DRAFT_3035901 [Cantharellus anzutake]KAF8340530.1 hypothetical protein EI90DRAFT_3035901 [Cantharellus anzutake]
MVTSHDEAGTPLLNWGNVWFGFLFIVLDIFLSIILGVKIGGSLLSASVRCVLQLSLLGLVLQSVFNARNGWAVFGITVLLMCLGTFEVVINKTKMRFTGMVPAIMASMIIGTVPVSIIGGRFAMRNQPFWAPEEYIPTIGMLCGNAISAIVVATNSVLRELETKRENIEVFLAFGATRLEACRPIAIEALRLALLPTINAMSVVGLISIPGMMTGALLGGSSVDQAAKLQMVIMFMITAASALASITSTLWALTVTVDDEHRIRPDRIQTQQHSIWRAWDRLGNNLGSGIRSVLAKVLPPRINPFVEWSCR